MIITILVFLLILSVLVLIHEGGHFFMAKKFGIKVEEFGFGFPPRMFSIKRGETEYSINWLPIGGFVKLYGEDDAGAGKIDLGAKKELDKDLNRAFFAKSAWQRAAVIFAGVVMNALLAAIIFYTFLGISGFKTDLPLLSDYRFFGVNQTNTQDVIISEIAKNSPAQKQGLEASTRIISVNGEAIKTSEQFVDIVNKNKGHEIEITWTGLDTNDVHKTKIIPRLVHPKNEGALGVGLFSMSKAVLNYGTTSQKIFSGITYPINLMGYNLSVIAKLVNVSFQEKSTEPLSSGISGPVGIASITGSILEIKDLKEKILGLLNLAGLLSISLAFFNVLPIPALDGGRLFFILIEAFTGKKVNQRAEAITHTVGMIILLSLMAIITLKDIGQLFIK